MNPNERIEKAKEDGIVHFWDLPKTNHVILQPTFKSEVMKTFVDEMGSPNKASKLSGVGRTTIRRYLNREKPKIRIDFLLKISGMLRNRSFDNNQLEPNIIWIGDVNSKGVANPKLPFNFNSREGARFLAAICNDGWISDGVYYSNSESDLRKSVKNDALKIFGGNVEAITEAKKANDTFLRFPSIVRDTLIILTGFRGVKSENNPPVPKFILKNKELICGWIEQTIADEGCVKFYPLTYRREIMWKRAFKKELNDYKLHEDEKVMLNKIGIEYYTYDNVGNYKTINSVDKITILVRIAKRENLLKLRKLVRIPSERKDNNFTNALKDYERPKEPLGVKDAITKICKENLFVNGIELKNELNYKRLNAATKWLNFYQRQGLLKRLDCGGGKIPVDFVLNKT